MNLRDMPRAPEVGMAAPGDRPRIAIEVEPSQERDHPVVRGVYRVFELASSLVALVVFLPVMLIEALIIKIDSPGPAIFVQWRYGRSKVMRGSELAGRTDIVSATGRFEPDKLYWVPTLFRFVKFRTMYVDARERFPAYYACTFDNDAQFRAGFYKLDDDPRVTRVGRWLRKATLDELPNFWNIVTGSIGLVGPRPENPAYMPFYTAKDMPKFTVRPGITGLAVINGRGKLSIGGQIEWDLVYVRERSVLLDLKVILATVWMVLVRRGAF